MLVDLKPVGEGYMEDFHAAGGMGAVLRELQPLLHLDCLDVDGRTLGERLDEPAGWVDRSGDPPVRRAGLDRSAAWSRCTASLAPDGAIFKRAAATPRCSRPRAAPWCSRASRIWPPASTIRTST